MLFEQGKYKSLEEEVESMREIMGKLRDKYKKAQNEIKDLEHEFQDQKEGLLDIVRTQEKSVKFSAKILKILLSDNELYKLHQKSKWDDEKGDWHIPLFTFNAKNKDIAFPTINAKERVQQAKEERELEIQGDANVPEKMDQTQSQFRKQGNFNSKNDKSSARKKQTSNDDMTSGDDF